jgi:hypothetical protein
MQGRETSTSVSTPCCREVLHGEPSRIRTHINSLAGSSWSGFYLLYEVVDCFGIQPHRYYRLKTSTKFAVLDIVHCGPPFMSTYRNPQVAVIRWIPISSGMAAGVGLLRAINPVVGPTIA